MIYIWGDRKIQIPYICDKQIRSQKIAMDISDCV